MASYCFNLPIGITVLVLLCVFIISIPTTYSQNAGNPPKDDTFARCQPGSSLMMLVPCESFVQGTESLPSSSCCSNLKELLEEDEDLRCLCLFLNDPNVGAIPINRTRALQLPNLCNLQANIFDCSAGTRAIPGSPSSPASQVISGTNSTVAASPVITVVPKSSIMGFNSHSIGKKLGAESPMAMALLTAIVFAGRI